MSGIATVTKGGWVLRTVNSMGKTIFCHESDMAGLNTSRQVADLKDFQ